LARWFQGKSVNPSRELPKSIDKRRDKASASC
jgi:hypothetical protein